jgi:hypothetical protein
MTKKNAPANRGVFVTDVAWYQPVFSVRPYAARIGLSGW